MGSYFSGKLIRYACENYYASSVTGEIKSETKVITERIFV